MGPTANRSKVTLACSTCRKRRAKCNGVHPCDLCKKSGSVCSFDANQAKRRGPRPRIAVQSVIHSQKIAPAPAPSVTPRVSGNSSSPVQIVSPLQPRPSIAKSVSSNSISRPFDSTQSESRHAVTPLRRQVAFAVRDDVEQRAAEEDDAEIEDDDQIIPALEDWRQPLDFVLSFDPQTTTIIETDLAAHLIEVFWRTASVGLRTMIGKTSFFSSLIEASVDPALCLALCANGAKYSCHIDVKGSHGRALALKVEETCRKRLVFNRREVTTGDLFTLCVIADTLTSHGCGAQAWIDIGTARKLLHIVKVAQSPLQVPEETLTAIEEYLSVAELIHGVGHGALCAQSSALAFTYSLSRTRLLHDLLQLCIRISDTDQSALTYSNPAPWTSMSGFKLLQEELESYSLKHVAQFQADATFTGLESEEEKALRSCCILMWHCSVVMLNRHFLPVPQVNVDQSQRQKEAIELHNFPSAPLLFVNERSSVCQSSASAICQLCRDLVVDGCFLLIGPFIGFALFQSGLVLLNQLHCQKRGDHDGNLEDLKIVFTILGALRNVYAPAHKWIKTLFYVHDKRHLRSDVRDSLTEIFSSFMHRFIGTQDVAMTCWWPPHSHVAVESELTTKTTEKSLQAGPAKQNTSPSGARPDNSWVQQYATYLDEDIAIDGSVRDVPAVFATQQETIFGTDLSSATVNVRPPTQMSDSSFDYHSLRTQISPKEGAPSDPNSGQISRGLVPNLFDADFDYTHAQFMDHLQLGDQFWNDWTNSDIFDLPEYF